MLFGIFYSFRKAFARSLAVEQYIKQRAEYRKSDDRKQPHELIRAFSALNYYVHGNDKPGNLTNGIKPKRVHAPRDNDVRYRRDLQQY